MNKQLFLCFMLSLGLLVAYNAKRNKIIEKSSNIHIEQPKTIPDNQENLPQSPAKPAPAPVPTWTSFPKLRSVNNLGNILNDIESHMPVGHVYRDSNKVTWAHETTHGINSRIRMQMRTDRNINGFYSLEDRAAVIEEPRTTMRRVAARIPSDLQGPSFNLYLVEQRAFWDDTPLYLFDEWVAYTNGSECGRELNASGWYYELLQAHNFNVYCIYLAMEIQETCPDYDDRQFKSYLMWNIERTFRLAAAFDPAQARQLPPERTALIKAEDYHFGPRRHVCRHPEDVTGRWWRDDPTQSALEYSAKVKTSAAAEGLRTFARNYFGKDWCQKIYGF